MISPSERRTDPARTRSEILLVLGVSLGASAVYALVGLIAKLTAGRPLADQAARLNVSAAPGRPWLDLTLQLLAIGFALVPVPLAVHLLRADHHDPMADLGLRRPRPGWDMAAAVGLAALIGLPGLGLYYGAVALGVNAQVVPAGLPDLWWAVPVLLLAATQNAVVEEVIVVGYLCTRLRDLGWRVVPTLAASALLRGSYHLYQGFGGFVGNAIMGLIFGLFFLRTRRLLPLIVAHALLDIVAFVGYTLLHDRIDWL